MLNRPDVIEGVHSSMLEAGAEVVETDSFQGSRLKLEEWGLGEHTLEINTKAAEIARKAAGENRFVAGSIGPTGFLPASTDPTLGNISFAELVEVFAEQAARPGRRRRRPDHHRDRAGHPRGQGGDLRRPRGLRQTGRTLPIQTSVSLLPNGGKMLLGTDIQAVLTTLARARRRRDRAQLLDRPRGHARRDPLPRREQPAAGPLHPQRRPAPAGARRRDDLPRKAGAAGGDAGRVRRALRRRHRRRLLRDDAGAHRRDPRAGRRAACRASARRQGRSRSPR